MQSCWPGMGAPGGWVAPGSPRGSFGSHADAQACMWDGSCTLETPRDARRGRPVGGQFGCHRRS
eukprot:3194907-Pyramimonas_sp.AAC.1